MTSTEKNKISNDQQKRKEFENVDQNRNGFFPTNPTKDGNPIDCFHLTTESVKDEKPTKVQLNQPKEIHTMVEMKSLGKIESHQQIFVMEKQIGFSQEKLLYQSVKCKPDCSQSQENQQTNLLEKTPSIDLDELNFVLEKESSPTLEEKSNLIFENESIYTKEKYQKHI